jgi:hypothetical protein
MNTTFLQSFIPAFCIVFLGIVSLWAHHRKRRLLPKNAGPFVISEKIKRLDYVFKILLLATIAIGFVYGFLPEYYYMMIPIDPLDHPLINTIGILTLKASLVWTIWAQLNIDHTLFKIRIGIEDWSFQQIVSYSQKSLLSGILLMFVGFCVTISSVAAIFLCVIAVFLFEKLLRIE